MPKDLTRTDTRRALRNGATFAERILWNSLRHSQLDGRKFRRQHGIGPYVVDFYCPEERLAIELDGSIHELEHVREHDSVREAALVPMDVTVLRFPNDECLEQNGMVLDRIRATWSGREREPVRIMSSRSRATRRPKNGRRPESSTPQPPPPPEEGE